MLFPTHFLRFALPVYVGVVLFCVSGCGSNAFGPDWEGQALINSSLVDEDYQEANNNDAFEAAEYIELSERRVTIHGEITDAGDTDVFDLGPMSAGARVVVELNAVDELNGALALFDADGTCLLVNDHRNVYLGQAEPFVDVVLPADSVHCYLAVTTTPDYESPGRYELNAVGQWDQPQPETHPDVVLLDFEGSSNASVGSRKSLDIPRFDASDIDPAFAGQTDEIIADLVAKVRADFEGFDVTVLSTSEGGEYDDSMTHVYFGTYDPGLLGLADGVDEFNTLGPQEAIIFTDTFAAFMVLDPDSEHISQALANVTSHEVGHLLGLVHTVDANSIMDISASLNDMLEDQHFLRAPLHPEVFPVGFQDATQTMLAGVGGDAEVALAARKRFEVEKTLRPRLHSSGPPAREGLVFSSSALRHGYGGH